MTLVFPLLYLPYSQKLLSVKTFANLWCCRFLWKFYQRIFVRWDRESIWVAIHESFRLFDGQSFPMCDHAHEPLWLQILERTLVSAVDNVRWKACCVRESLITSNETEWIGIYAMAVKRMRRWSDTYQETCDVWFVSFLWWIVLSLTVLASIWEKWREVIIATPWRVAYYLLILAQSLIQRCVSCMVPLLLR